MKTGLDLRAEPDAVTAPRRRRDQLRASTVARATAQLVVGDSHGTVAGVAVILERLRSGGRRLHGGVGVCAHGDFVVRCFFLRRSGVEVVQKWNA